MKNSYKILLLLNSVILFFFIGCAGDGNTAEEKAASLEGHWELKEGYRGGKEAPSLAGTYFKFSGDQMSTNLPLGENEKTSFTKKDNVITQSINDHQLDYFIEDLSATTMQLKTNIRGIDFVFVLERKE